MQEAVLTSDLEARIQAAPQQRADAINALINANRIELLSRGTELAYRLKHVSAEQLNKCELATNQCFVELLLLGSFTLSHCAA